MSKSRALHHAALYSLDPRARMLMSLLLITTTSLTPARKILFLPPGLLFVIGLALFLGLPLAQLFKRSLLILPFVFFIAVLLPFSTPGPAMFSVNLFFATASASQTGLLLAATLLLRSYLALWIVLVFVSGDRFEQILSALASLHIPNIFMILLMFVYRYLFVIRSEATRMYQAFQARQVGHAMPLRRRLHLPANLIGLLFIRSYARAERIFQAMQARGFDGQVTAKVSLRWKKRDSLALLTTLAVSGLYCYTLFAARRG